MMLHPLFAHLIAQRAEYVLFAFSDLYFTKRVYNTDPRGSESNVVAFQNSCSSHKTMRTIR
jgi:hypothetical protein